MREIRYDEMKKLQLAPLAMAAVKVLYEDEFSCTVKRSNDWKYGGLFGFIRSRLSGALSMSWVGTLCTMGG